MDDELYRATVDVLADVGWDALTLDKVADRVGRSRVTLWRNGVSRDSLLHGLLVRLAEDYRDAMIPVLTSTGEPRARLEQVMAALCDVVDAHAGLLTVSDEIFHRAAALEHIPMRLFDPILRVLRDARAAGRLTGDTDDVDLADVLFNAVVWPYLHFRVRHGWAADRARRLLFATLLDGLLR